MVKCLNEPNMLVMPGDCLLNHQNDIIASSGTYLKNGSIYSSVAGYLRITEQQESHFDDKDDSKTTEEGANDSLNTSQNQIVKRIVKVIRPGDRQVPFLEPGSIVTCRVIRITSSFAKCSICCIEDHILKQPYVGIIRLDDIHDGVSAQQQRLRQVNCCFHPGDIVLARVIAAGDNHQFLLTTAAQELGVVVAVNDWNEPMIPLNSIEVLCQRTFTKESRKVANIDLIA
ncbi:exosome complex component CSL4-like protein [Euroglyphus maynei]|uniref:Exosome complex component CSL4-like protein n=1 Tax=Euroglyphus maynei TaxID=6958 RepID=A0A1Y3BGL4_EURMA|nr:exosome complex component CSL4-like protein [Euroglyphus maynei]